MTHWTRTGLLVAPLLVFAAGEPASAQDALGRGTGGMVEGQTPTEWAIAPAGSVLPEGTFLPEAPSAAPGKSDAPPQGAILETRSTEEGVPYMSGGIGVSEREELAQVKSQYNLRLLFAVQGSGEYLSNIQVRVEEVSGRTRLAAVSQGPFFYARLAPGRYNLTVDAAGQVQTRQVTVPANGATEQSFYWASHYTIGDAPR